MEQDDITPTGSIFRAPRPNEEQWFGSTRLRQRLHTAKSSWEALLLDRRPEIPCNLHWSKHTVLSFARTYIVTRYGAARRDQGLPVRPITILNWTTDIVFCILRFTFDPDTQQKCGREVLIGTGGLFQELTEVARDLAAQGALWQQ